MHLLLLWLAFAAPLPVSVTVSEGINGADVTVTNESDRTVTAIAISESVSNPGRPVMFDSAMLFGWHALKAHASGRITFRLIETPRVEAGILDDGTVFGNPAAVDEILQRRRSVLSGIGVVMDRFPETVAPDLSRQEVIRLFQSARRKELAGIPLQDPLQAAIININSIIERRLKSLPDQISAKEACAYIQTMLNDWRESLRQSKPSLAN
jgi:hypothetical protein